MGLGNILAVPGVAETKKPTASFGKMREASKGKDTVAGHWEIAGIILDRPFPAVRFLYPERLDNECAAKRSE